MANPKRRADHIARLIVKAAPRFSVGMRYSNVLPPSEWRKLSDEVHRIYKMDRRRHILLWSVVTFPPLAVFIPFLSWVGVVNDKMPVGIAVIIALLGSLILWAMMVIWFSSFILPFVQGTFVHGFVLGLLLREPGAPKKWTTVVCKEAVAAVQAVAAETGLGVARSIDILKKRDPVRWEGLSEQRYYEAMRQLREPAG
jgi:hypothetical protein